MLLSTVGLPRRLALATLLLAVAASPSVAQDTRDVRPTVAVMYFTNGALVRNADYAPLSKGIATILITELAANSKIRVVEREQLQAVLEEQNLGTAGRVDNETAAKVGKILGARHMLMGGFVIDPSEQMRLDVRAVNVETSAVEYTESIRGKAADLLDLVSTIGERVNTGLKLPSLAAGGASKSSSATPAKKPSREGLRLAMLLGRASEEQDKKNVNGAIVLVNQALEIDPNDPSAKKMLASLQRQKGD
jgi:curli biogenesis system outer membrane secretion channel CsgG